MPLKDMNIFGNTDKPSLNIKDILKDFLKVNSLNEILHALDKYSESSKINKDYIAVINQVIDFVIPIYSYLGEGVFCNLDKWDCSERKWLEC